VDAVALLSGTPDLPAVVDKLNEILAGLHNPG
jgi:hypothetical protein